jgi:hypothetical protein
MKGSLVCAIAAAMLLAAAGCKSKKPEVPATVEEPASVRTPPGVKMGDTAAAGQLVSGFHAIEDGSWRWTQKQFTVRLGTPVGAGASGATLTFDFSIPPVSIQKLGPITLVASVGGTKLEPQTYTMSGSQKYQQSVSASALNSGAVDVVFQLDKAIPPAGADARELGVVAIDAGLEGK